MVDWYALQSMLLWLDPFIILGGVIIGSGAVVSIAISAYRSFCQVSSLNKMQAIQLQGNSQQAGLPNGTPTKPPNIAIGLAMNNLITTFQNETGLSQDDALEAVNVMTGKMLELERKERVSTLIQPKKSPKLKNPEPKKKEIIEVEQSEREPPPEGESVKRKKAKPSEEVVTYGSNGKIIDRESSGTIFKLLNPASPDPEKPEEESPIKKEKKKTVFKAGVSL